MITNTQVSEIMTRKVIYAGHDNNFSQIKQLFMEYNLHHLPVVDNGKLVGIISTNDLIRCFESGASDFQEDTLNHAFTIEKLMTKNPIDIAPETSIATAVDIMQKHNFQALPVVGTNGLTGIITMKDVVKFLMDSLEE